VGFGIVAFRSDDAQLFDRSCNLFDVTRFGCPAVRQKNHHLARGSRPCQLLGCGTQCTGKVGRTKTTQGQNRIHHIFPRAWRIL
jgi:hypothetical protein